MSPSSHPPALIQSVRRCLRDECALLPATRSLGAQSPGAQSSGVRLAIGVSGGADSMALLDVLSKLREDWSFDLLAVSVDHGLRPEAKDEVRLVHEFCQGRQVAFESAQLQLEPSGNLQARAREARYAALWQAAEAHWGEPALLATAHHRDDRAETVLLRMLRGVSLPGLGVLPPRAKQLLRPMVRASRRDVLMHCERHEVPFVSDPSNRDEQFLRVKVRQQLLPLLRELSPGIESHLCQLADEALTGEPALGLNREQRQQLQKALSNPAISLDLPLRGGLRVVREDRQRRRHPKSH